MLRLALDASDPLQRARVESMFECSYAIKRALQRDVRDRSRAYWAAPHERAKDPGALRARLGLSRTDLEYRAYAHLDGAPHLRRFVTKALAMHLADSVWTGAERHLFPDAAGNRHGAPRIGAWHEFTRLPGRARSHRPGNKWETFRLHGTLAGHRAAYTDYKGDFVQPRRLRAVESTAWWSYDGPLAIVFTGLADGTLVLPVRLPTAPCNQPILEHYLGDPDRWHKIDLVRHQDPHAEGGWRYEAHLVVLGPRYVSPAVLARRAQAAIETAGRTAGIDVNVSNVTIASHDGGRDVRLTRVERDEPHKQRDRSRARRDRRRKRALDRSRRATNRAHYHLSKRQEKQARRRAERGLPPLDQIPMGPRKTSSVGARLQSGPRDQLSNRYKCLRATQAVQAEAATRLRRDRAREMAGQVVAAHGVRFVVEDCSIVAWAPFWGRALASFAPATLLAAIDREVRAVAQLAGGEGSIVRASTRTTALSQHCPCGDRVPKGLVDRVHVCASCGLRGDRDAVAAVLASFVVLVQPDEPASARVDYQASAAALDEIRQRLQFSYTGWQDTLSESTDLCAHDGSFVVWRTSTPDTPGQCPRTPAGERAVAARRNVGTASCATRNEPGACQTTSDRARKRTDRSSMNAREGRAAGHLLDYGAAGRPRRSCRVSWFGDMDSNHDSQIQSLTSYH